MENEEIKVSSLPKTQSWKLSINLFRYQEFWYYEYLLKGVLSFQKNFIPQPTDMFLCTTPKCGTNWLKALCVSIQTRTQYINGDSPLLSKPPRELIVNQELAHAFGTNRNPEIPIVHTHVPFSSLPASILNSSGKIIYICRDPKDVLISQFFFNSKHGDGQMLPFEEVYEKFCNGISNCGPFWDHVLGYWKASLEFPGRILFLKYEDLMNNTCLYVKKIADFMGCGFSEDELKDGTLDSIVEMCSFENLSNLEVNKRISKIDDRYIFSDKAFFRKGKIGDWKNYLSVEMAERIDKITYQKFNGYGLYM